MIDCSVTENYLKEKARLSKNCEIDCSLCPLCSKNNCLQSSCTQLEQISPNLAVVIVQKWSDSCPMKTYKDDFLEHFPKAKINVNGVPSLCRKYVYGFENGKSGCRIDSSCERCWNEEMMEESQNCGEKG